MMTGYAHHSKRGAGPRPVGTAPPLSPEGDSRF